MSETPATKQHKQRAGHYEILGETYAQFELFEQGWNPYSRFLDVDKVDFILRRRIDDQIVYREVQVKYGKLYDCTPKWEKELFDITSWRFFKPGEFDAFRDRSDFFMCFVFAADIGYRGDIFIFPISDFVRLLDSVVGTAERKKLLISRSRSDSTKWYLRKQGKFTSFSKEAVEDVSHYRRAFHLLQPNGA